MTPRPLIRWTPVLVLLCALPAGAQQQSRAIFFDLTPAAPAVEHRDITYRAVGDRELKMDLYLPPGSSSGAPVPIVVFASGGVGAGPEPRTWPGYVSWGRVAAASGFAGVTFTHRLGFPKRYYKEAASDLHALLDHLKTLAPSHNLAADRVGLVVFSGGGPLMTVPLRDRPSPIRAIAGFYPFLDTDHVDPVAAQTDPDEVREHSPARHVQPAATMPPMLVLRAGQDRIAGVNDSIDRFTAMALAANLPFTVANHPEGEHGFDARNDVPRTRELIAQALAFLHAHLDLRR